MNVVQWKALREQARLEAVARAAADPGYELAMVEMALKAGRTTCVFPDGRAALHIATADSLWRRGFTVKYVGTDEDKFTSFELKPRQ